ncbi:MAG: J domain-containing protein [Halothiobacillaceae bacterium]|nr:MAG: J domain-containing protein [Halothiobacillaceae bacterium]
MAFKDYYAVLGVAPDAPHELIRLAYRRLARQYHPDINREAGAEERFKAINEAHDVLADAARRAAYDQMRQQVQASPALKSATRRTFDEWLAGFSSLRDRARDLASRDTLRDFFTDAGLAGRTGRAARGEDQRAPLRLGIEEMARGAHRECTVRLDGADGPPLEKRVKVRIPAGITPGKRIRLAGMGAAGEPAGDLFLQVELEPHPHFVLDGRDVLLSLPLAPWEAALGAALQVPTPLGPVQLKIPAGTPSGKRLRLRGRGLPGHPAGDLLVDIQIQLPPALTPEARAFYEDMALSLPFNPRESFADGS